MGVCFSTCGRNFQRTREWTGAAWAGCERSETHTEAGAPVTKGALLADELNKRPIQEDKFIPRQSPGKTNAGQQPGSACLLPSEPSEPFCVVLRSSRQNGGPKGALKSRAGLLQAGLGQASCLCYSIESPPPLYEGSHSPFNTRWTELQAAQLRGRSWLLGRC